MLNWLQIALVADGIHLSLANPQQQKRFKTAKQKKKVPGVWWKTLSSDNYWDQLCFNHRRLSKLSHSSAPSVATVAFCLHIADRHLRCWSKQPPISGNERVNCVYFMFNKLVNHPTPTPKDLFAQLTSQSSLVAGGVEPRTRSSSPTDSRNEYPSFRGK